MNTTRNYGFAALVLALSVIGMSIGTPSEAKGFKLKGISIKKVGRSIERSVNTAVKGDSDTNKLIITRTVQHAIDRFHLADLVTAEDVSRARLQLKHFLYWKMGSATAMAAQYTTAGQGHFNRAYSDEAAAALLGVELPGDGQPEMRIPPNCSKRLQETVMATGKGAQAALMATYGIPPQVSGLIVDQLVKNGNKAIARVGFNMPKSWDVDNRLIEAMISSRRS